MTPTAAPIPGLPAIRPARAGLAALVLLAMLGPLPTAEAVTTGKVGGHSCCCGTVCHMGCCGNKATDRAPRPDTPSSAADIATLLAADPSPCVGPMPCGGDPDAPPSLNPTQQRPADLPSSVRLALLAGPSLLSPSIERLRPSPPGDPPEEPPEPDAAVAAP